MLALDQTWLPNKNEFLGSKFLESGPRRARTVDPRIKSPLLYRLSYRPHCETGTNVKFVMEFGSVPLHLTPCLAWLFDNFSPD